MLMRWKQPLPSFLSPSLGKSCVFGYMTPHQHQHCTNWLQPSNKQTLGGSWIWCYGTQGITSSPAMIWWRIWRKNCMEQSKSRKGKQWGKGHKFSCKIAILLQLTIIVAPAEKWIIIVKSSGLSCLVDCAKFNFNKLFQCIFFIEFKNHNRFSEKQIVF